MLVWISSNFEERFPVKLLFHFKTLQKRLRWLPIVNWARDWWWNNGVTIWNKHIQWVYHAPSGKRAPRFVLSTHYSYAHAQIVLKSSRFFFTLNRGRVDFVGAFLVFPSVNFFKVITISCENRQKKSNTKNDIVVIATITMLLFHQWRCQHR